MMTSNSPRVLAVHPGALGDVVLFGRLMERLVGRATLIAGGQKADLLGALGVVSDAMDFDSLPISEIFTDTPLEQCALPGWLGEHDLLISCFGDGASPDGQRLAGAARVERASFLPIRPPEGFDGHLLALWAHLLGMDAPALDPPGWGVSPALRRSADEMLSAAGVVGADEAVLLHPGSGSAEKNWPIERYVALAEALRSVGWEVWWSLGPVEREQGMDRALQDRGAPGALLGPMTLGELAGVLAASEVVVGNDSGVSHLAAAIGRRTVSLFGPAGNADHFRPIGPAVTVLEADSLEDIAPGDVLERVSQP